MKNRVVTIELIILVLGISALGIAHIAAAVGGTSSASRLRGETTTLLPDGRWLQLGGDSGAGATGAAAVASCASCVPSTLSGRLRLARAWHTATVLPNGFVLVFGGIGPGRQLAQSAELFDAATGNFMLLPSIRLTPRAHHSATLLTDGELLLVGGVDADGGTLSSAELWDFRTGTSTLLTNGLVVARSDHMARLLPDGRVLFWGGTDAVGDKLSYGELFDPSTKSFSLVTDTESLANGITTPTQLAFSSPEDGAVDVSVDTLISLRFSNPINPRTVTNRTITLSAANGKIAANVVAAEGGMLVFITPKQLLDPGSSFLVSISGVADQAGVMASDAQIQFTSRSTQQASTDRVDVASPEGSTSDASALLPPLHAPVGVTALSGQILTLSKQPVAGVKVELDGVRTTTDGTGRFLLSNVLPGPRMIVVDARPASRTGVTYGTFMFQVIVGNVGGTTVLPFTIWMPALDTEHAIEISVPTTREIVATTPRIPGLEVHIPAGIRIRDMDGNLVHTITITPISTERPPFPLPPGVKFPVYFSLQPDGAMIEGTGQQVLPGIREVIPNSARWAPGTRSDFWTMDPTTGAWIVYGKGTVTPDGRQVVPDPGIGIHMLTCGSTGNPPGNPPPTYPIPGPSDGEPVNLSSGLFVHSRTDFYLPDTIPIVFTRVYRPGDTATPSRSFGLSTTHSYNIFLYGSPDGSGTYLILPDGGRVFYPANPNSNTLVSTSTPTIFYGSVLTQGNELNELGPGGTTITLKNGTVLFFEYTNPDAIGFFFHLFLSAIKDRYGNVLHIDRNTSNDQDITRITSPNGRYLTFLYDQSHRITQISDSLGRTASYTYDSNNRLATVNDVNGGVTTYGYSRSALDEMLTITDPRGNVFVTNQYDSNERVTKQTLANGGTYQFAYTLNANGQVIQTNVTNPLGVVRKVTFDSAGYAVTDTAALGMPEQQTLTYARLQPGELIFSITDTLGRQTTLSYDAMANITGITRLANTANAVTATITYDPVFNQPTSITDPINHIASFSYDTAGSLVDLGDPLGHHTTLTYNADGRVATITDAEQNTSHFAYTGPDLTAITDPLGNTTTRFFDGAGRLLSVADPLGNTTQYLWNPLDQPTSLTDALGNVISLTYDANGNMLTLKDPRNNVTTYTYDNVDRVTSRKDALLHLDSYTYDAAGNLTKVTDRKSQVTTLKYDGLNRVTFAGFGTVSQGKTTTYQSTITATFDGGNRVTQLTDSLAGSISRVYDGLDRLISETTPQGSVSRVYDAAGRRSSMTVSGQAAVAYTYDANDRLTQMTQGTAAVTFGYDKADRRTSLILPNSVTASYTYDPTSRLTGIAYANAGGQLGVISYTYDVAGRRVSMGGGLAGITLPAAVTSATYNANNQQTNWNGIGETYDLNGSLINDGTRVYTWDARNHLSAIGALTFQYDGIGRRTKNAATNSILYDGPNAVEELSGSTLVAQMLKGDTDETFTRSDSGGTWSFLPDALGSTVALSNSMGAIATQYTYDPFGNTAIAGAANGNSYEFTGRENDSNGMYYYRARYYSSTLGRFISEDPIHFASGTVNLYAYADDNPVNETDPSGLRTQACCRQLRRLVGQITGYNHCYVLITSEDDQLQWHTYGLHREDANDVKYPGGPKPIMDDPTDVGGSCSDVKGATPCKEREFVKKAMSNTSCPSCGRNYWFLSTNSNYWVWNSLEDAGMTPPVFPGGNAAPGYGPLPSPPPPAIK